MAVLAIAAASGLKLEVSRPVLHAERLLRSAQVSYAGDTQVEVHADRFFLSLDSAYVLVLFAAPVTARAVFAGHMFTSIIAFGRSNVFHR